MKSRKFSWTFFVLVITVFLVGEFYTRYLRDISSYSELGFPISYSGRDFQGICHFSVPLFILDLGAVLGFSFLLGIVFGRKREVDAERS